MAKAVLVLVLITALVVVATLWRAARREAAAEQTFPPEGEIITVDGFAVHVVVRGQGPDLVLIHGSSGNTRDMTFNLVDQLADRFRVIVFDRPGLGYSDRLTPDGATISEQAAHLRAAAAQLGATRPIVMGQSLGGAVALAWAVDHPDDLAALVLVSAPSFEWSGGLSNYYKVLSNPVAGPMAAALVSAWVPDGYVRGEIESIFAPQTAPGGYAEYVGAGLTLRRASLRANALQRARLKPQITAMSARYDRIVAPVEIVHGTADDTVFADIHSERLAAVLGDAGLALLDGIGHMPHHVAQPDVVAAIDRAAARAGLR